MLVSIKGNVYRDSCGRDYYDVRAYYKNGDGYEICASLSTGILTGKSTGGLEELALECHAWGYDGVGPQLLACNILSYFSSGGNPYIARKYYNEFTTEVIAMLPDDKPWELTRRQIERWLRDKQTKGKQDERESTKTKVG